MVVEKLPGGQDTAASVVPDAAWCTDAAWAAVPAFSFFNLAGKQVETRASCLFQ